MTAGLSAVVVGADRLGNIPDLLKGHNISITHHISGRDPSHQKKTLQLPSGTQLVILLTDFLGHNVMKTFRNARSAAASGSWLVAARSAACSRHCSNAACAARGLGHGALIPTRFRPGDQPTIDQDWGGLRACGAKRRETKRRRTVESDGVFVFVLAAMSPAGAACVGLSGGRAGRGHHVVVQAAGTVVALGPVGHGHVLDADHAAGAGEWTKRSSPR